ncbi:T9SS type A sorting domain-containing protein [Dyadobacter sp. CY343]|uniref:T9SS type A sorting domain-containing protein n=1 Tax=Dyadobacter sp. CY343 TaxID=2907299 RepID=UPI001F481142|nr:T9SS type A sorting domain-containing protein [Dyadobacter sp. CY343]MCE7061963.1 T9SS type A sorting domain-containing protein [Dyadobacter sp. CY343]
MLYSNVPGASAYRIQVTSLTDSDFAYPSDDIISSNQYPYTPYFGGYKWRVKAIVDGKEGKWSEIGYFSINPRLNITGLYLPIPDDLLNAPRTIPIAYSPSNYYSNTSITIADNPGFSNPLFQRNYKPFMEIADVVKDLPANTQLYFRVQERNTDLINFPDRDLIDYVFSFTTGNTNGPPALTFLSEKDQHVFGRMNPKIALSKGHVWLGVLDAGFIKLDQKALTFQAFNRDNTDGLLGIGLDNPVRTDNELNVHTINPTDGNKFRKVKLVNEVPSSEATVTPIHFVGYVQDFNPQHGVFWTQTVIFKETNGGFVALRQVSENQFIRDIRFRDNKAWILLVNTDRDYSTEILVMDLNDHDLIYTINFETSPAIENVIDQIEIQPDGKVWLRQTDFSTLDNSIAYFDGSSWSLFNSENAPFGNRISSIGLSPSGKPFLLSTGSETQVYKFNNTTWEKAGEPLPYRKFEGDLLIDTYESFWISNRFGLARLASKEALPVTLVNFSAAPENNIVVLTWQVTDQVNMASYVIEHSTNAKNFHVIGQTPAVDTTFYSFAHANPNPGINYFRLKSTELDASFVYSKVIKVSLNNLDDIVFYPNPATDQLQVKLRHDMIGQSGQLSIFARDGKRIHVNKFEKLRAQESINVSNLEAGNYLIQIENKNGSSSRAIQIVR